MLQAPLGYAMEIMARSADEISSCKFQCTFAQLLQIFVQIASALTFAHEHDVIHFDIKPENILLDEACTVAKLCDFGCARSLHATAGFTATVGVVDEKAFGSIWYMAPEVFGGHNIYDHHNAKLCDIYSFGKTMWKLLHPLEESPLECKVTANVPPALKELVRQCTLANPKSRPQRMSEILQLLLQIQDVQLTSDTSADALFKWQSFDEISLTFVNVHPAAFAVLEEAFLGGQPMARLSLQAPLDLIFDMKDMLSSPSALGTQTEMNSGFKRSIRRVHKISASSSKESFPIWQELVDGKEWRQCNPAMCAKLAMDAQNGAHVDAVRYRPITLDCQCIDKVQLPHSFKSEPHFAPAGAVDIAMLNTRVHDSLPEWDITNMVQVVNLAQSSKYAAYRHQVATRCNGDPNERMMFHFAHPTVTSTVGQGAYFYEHAVYGYACKYSLFPLPPSFELSPEPEIGESMELSVSLVCLGNVADMGPGCETCSSPAWDAWQKEFEQIKPTRPPTILLPTDSSEKQHVLNLNHGNAAPYYDSVCSTEGDLGAHPASTKKDSQGNRMCDIMHPRLRDGAKEWGKHCVLFDPAASYSMFVLTLTKQRDSHTDPLQLMESGCDVNRIKALGYNASHFKAKGKTVHEMRMAGWATLDLKNAGYNSGSLFIGGCSTSELRRAGFTASQVQNAVASFNETERSKVSAHFEHVNFDLSVYVDLVAFFMCACAQAAEAAQAVNAMNLVCSLQQKMLYFLRERHFCQIPASLANVKVDCLFRLKLTRRCVSHLLCSNLSGQAMQTVRVR